MAAEVDHSMSDSQLIIVAQCTPLPDPVCIPNKWAPAAGWVSMVLGSNH